MCDKLGGEAGAQGGGSGQSGSHRSWMIHMPPTVVWGLQDREKQVGRSSPRNGPEGLQKVVP